MDRVNRNKLFKLGENRNNYSNINNRLACVIATLYLDINNKELILDLTNWTREWSTPDNDFKDVRTHIGYFRVGSLNKPEKRKIARALKLNKPDRPFSLTGWEIDKKDERGNNFFVNLNCVLTYAISGENNKITRALKLAEIKKKIKNG